MVEMASSVSLTLLMSYPTDHALDSEIPQNVSHNASTALCSCFAANHANQSCFGGMNAYSIHWQTHLYNYMFNKDNIEHTTQIK